MWLVVDKLGVMLTSLIASAGVLLTIFLAGKRAQKKSDAVEALESYIEAEERVNEVHASADRDAAIKRLRDNDQIRD